MSARCLYRVRLDAHVEVAVLAESSEQARLFAETDFGLWGDNFVPAVADVSTDVRAIVRPSEIPGDDHELPYLACDVDDEEADRSSAEWLEAGAAERAVAEREARDLAAQVPLNFGGGQ